MADIFLSYAHEERERVRPLVTAFEAQGWSVWWDQQLETGESWDEEIEKELANARVVVTVFSAQSVESRFVRAESMEAYDNDKLFPVRLDDIKVPITFRTVQVADRIKANTYNRLLSQRSVNLGSNTATSELLPRVSQVNLDLSRLL